jgi:hypothetical protein
MFQREKKRGLRLLLIMVINCGLVLAQESVEELYNYSGTIGDHTPIGMTLIFDGDKIHGVYFYAKWLQDIELRGHFEDARQVTIDEVDEQRNVRATFRGRFVEWDPQGRSGLAKMERLLL